MDPTLFHILIIKIMIFLLLKAIKFRTWISIVVFGVAFFLFVKVIFDICQVEQFLSVAGRIVSSELRSEKVDGGTLSIQKETSVIFPFIQYRYVIDGTQYIGSSIEIHSIRKEKTSDNIAEAKRLLSRYSIGKDVTVWYSKADPNVSVLEKEINFEILFIFGLFGLISGLSSILFVRHDVFNK